MASLSRPSPIVRKDMPIHPFCPCRIRPHLGAPLLLIVLCVIAVDRT